MTNDLIEMLKDAAKEDKKLRKTIKEGIVASLKRGGAEVFASPGSEIIMIAFKNYLAVTYSLEDEINKVIEEFCVRRYELKKLFRENKAEKEIQEIYSKFAAGIEFVCKSKSSAKNKRQNEFLRNIILNELSKLGYDAEKAETTKNGVTFSGIIIHSENNNTSPILYTEKYLEGWTIETAVEDIIKTYESVKTKTFDTKKFFNWDYMKDNLQLCIQKRGIENILKKDFLDLEIYIRCIVDADSTGTGSFKIKEEHLKTIGVDAETVFAQAIKCSKKEILTKTMAEIMSAEMGIEIQEELSAPMQYVISNKTRTNGAAVIAIPEVLSELAEKLKGDLVILPSSIHEVIVMKDEDFEPYTLNTMVQEVNETALVPEEILSNHAYKFLRETKEVICL